jgi:multiple sugar transport system permease protein
MRPAIAALSVLIFTFIWNDYFWAIVLTQGPTRSRSPPGSRSLQRPIRRAMAPPDERGQHRRRAVCRRC